MLTLRIKIISLVRAVVNDSGEVRGVAGMDVSLVVCILPVVSVVFILKGQSSFLA